MNVEWLILADAAQIVGGKLYLMGGGWDVLTVNSPYPVHHRCAIAASFRIPWNETNQRNNVEVVVATEDGRELGNVRAQMEVGRPAGLPPGSDQRAQLAAEMALQFQGPGIYVIVARIEGEEAARYPFRVVAGSGSRPAPPPQG
jgi:hypothetical protein